MSYMVQKVELRPPAGFINYSLEEQTAFFRMQKQIQEQFQKFGFTPFQLRNVERQVNLQAKGGIGHQIFGISHLADGVTSTTDQATKLALPFDHTVPAAIFLAQQGGRLSFPLKRSHVGPVYRGEAPQQGRFREFVQCDVDVFGRDLGVQADAEAFGAILTALRSIPEVGEIVVYLNHIKLVQAMLKTLKIEEKHMPDVLRCIDSLDKESDEAVIRKIMEKYSYVDEPALKNLIKCFLFKGLIQDFEILHEWGEEAQQAKEELIVLFKSLIAQGIPEECLQFSPAMVRGLDYYTGPVFETFLKRAPELGSITSGGRYDRLVDVYANRETGIQGTGAAIGLTRLFDILKRRQELLMTAQTTTEVFICSSQELVNREMKMQSAAKSLRDRGVYVDVYSGSKDDTLKKIMKYANRKGFPYVLILRNNETILKNMNEPRESQGTLFEVQEQAIDEVCRIIGKMRKEDDVHEQKLAAASTSNDS